MQLVHSDRRWRSGEQTAATATLLLQVLQELGNAICSDCDFLVQKLAGRGA